MLWFVPAPARRFQTVVAAATILAMRRVILLALAAMLSACARSAAPPAIAVVLQEDGARGAVIQRHADGVQLYYRVADGWRRRPWSAAKTAKAPQTPKTLGDALVLTGAPGGALFDGSLSISKLADAADASSSRLANGWLADGDKLAGWCPGVARASDGKLHLAFDAFRSGDYDVVYRGPDGVETVVAGSKAFEAHPSISADSAQRVWLAWDSAGEDWGHDGALHESRAIHLAVLDRGAWHDVALPDNALVALDRKRGLSEPDAAFAELPHVVVEQSGPVWLFYRTMSHAEGEGRMGSTRHVVWQIRALVLTDGGWQGPYEMPQSDGGNTDTLAAIATSGEGIAAAYETDGRTDRLRVQWFEPIGVDPKLIAVELHASGGAPRTPSAVRKCGRVDPPSTPLPADPDPSLAPRGFVRVWGDLHRHTDASRCKLDLDGTVLDQFRYAHDVAALDFVAVTDHYQQMTPATWAFTCETTSLFDVPSSFVTLYGFELALQTGHRNLVCIDPEVATPGPLGRVAENGEWKSTFRAHDWIAIPHQIADATSPLQWSKQDPDVEPLVEIYQERRGSFEARSAPRRAFYWDKRAPSVVDYLVGGRHFGLIASSDHISTGHAFAACYARGRTRHDVFEALLARHTYAATAKIALDVSLGACNMGDHGRVERNAPLIVRAAAGAEIAHVDVIRNGAVAASWHGAHKDRGVVTVSVSNREEPREIAIEFKGTTLGKAIPQSLERSDSLVQTSDRIVLRSVPDSNLDDDGVSVPVTLGAGARVTVSVGPSSRELTFAELASGPPDVFELDKLPIDVRLDPPPLATARIDEKWSPGDWKSGDWVYVRLVRVDGEMAWSSPIWVD
jgi:hypothetical protein